MSNVTEKSNSFEKELLEIDRLKEEMFKRAFGKSTDRGGPLAALAYANLIKSELKIRKLRQVEIR